ncbi:adenosylcobinamide-GDP ribazoletransferase [Propionibacteriaceae bacterium Y1700]|uniref:adenosylcobinamide-GDP ribazoletransferase n=1 Tax=Microlunatus sp. Y1700 TaxID=3418487 RepID=UPI003DA6E057
MSALAGLRLAVGTLTTFPVGEVGVVDRRTAAWAMTLAPVAVLPVTVPAVLIMVIGQWLQAPGLLIGLLIIGWLALGTRAMHLDGLADTVDGLGASLRPERVQQVMKSGDVGPMGVVALVIALGLQAVGLAEVAAKPYAPVVVLILICASRAALAISCLAGIPVASWSTLGQMVVGTVTWPRATAVVLLTAAALTGAALLGQIPWWWAMICTAFVVALPLTLARTAARRLGGTSGDVLGAGVELTLTALLVLWAVS